MLQFVLRKGLVSEAGGLGMKRRISILIDEEVIRLAKLRAIEENRRLNDLIQEALVSYLGSKAPSLGDGEAAYRLFCEQPMKITEEQFRQILMEGA